MPEEIAGKTFYAPGELDIPPSTAEEIAEAKSMFAAFEQRSQQVAPEDRVPQPERYGDDMMGTEYEAWYLEQRAERKKRDESNPGPQ
jgi:hypothetical protein